MSETPSKPSVHVGVPTYGTVPAVCVLSFGSFIGQGVGRGLIRHLGQVEGAYIDRARNDLVRQALGNGATHVLFIDQDMIVPEESLYRLTGHGVDIVGAAYFGKDDLCTPVAYHLDPFHRIYELEDTPWVDTEAYLPEGVLDCWCGVSGNHLHDVGGTGMGLTLISVDVFRRMREHYGDEMWFSSKETGEDVHFSIRAKEMGIPRYLDGLIQCGHVRSMIVTRQNYDWSKEHAPKCDVVGCHRVAIWKKEEEAESRRCFYHREGDGEEHAESAA